MNANSITVNYMTQKGNCYIIKNDLNDSGVNNLLYLLFQLTEKDSKFNRKK